MQTTFRFLILFVLCAVGSLGWAQSPQPTPTPQAAPQATPTPAATPAPTPAPKLEAALTPEQTAEYQAKRDKLASLRKDLTIIEQESQILQLQSEKLQGRYNAAKDAADKASAEVDNYLSTASGISLADLGNYQFVPPPALQPGQKPVLKLKRKDVVASGTMITQP
jgi:hypothetical protein